MAAIVPIAAETAFPFAVVDAGMQTSRTTKPLAKKTVRKKKAAKKGRR